MLTNKLDLPEPVLRACEHNEYSRGDADYSVTELIKPARMAALQRLYGDSIVEDVADNIFSLFGRVCHMILQLSGAPETGAILEERLYANVGGTRISGAMDSLLLFPNGRLDDYKTTSVWAILDGLKPEWIAQLNLYRWLEEYHGRHVSELRVVAFLKDWSIGKSRTDGPNGRYPKQGVVALQVPMWDLEETQAYIEARISEHIQADRAVQECPENLIHCTDSERWVRPRRFAVMKPGGKRAFRVFDSEAEANMMVNANTGWHVERRGGEPIRCVDYCTVGRAGLCSQWEADKPSFAATGEAVDTSAFE